MILMLFLWLHYHPERNKSLGTSSVSSGRPWGPIGGAKQSPSEWGHWPHLGTDRSDSRSPARPVAVGQEQIARNIERVQWTTVGANR
uniref:Uncharacterized protein n=1 Tax=Aeromonas caviae TaxID=648 RepID=A0A1L0AYF4_AERCA|nr:Uncharacterised protein [Aeromonas caviae]